MMRTLIIATLVAIPLLLECKKPEDNNTDPVDNGPVTLTLADADATAETKALYSNLWAIRDKGWMFGHHDDLMYGRKWYGTEGGSDTKAVCGDYPAVYGLDVATFMDDRATVKSEDADRALRLKCMKEAYDRGMVIIACMHLNNPLTGASYGEGEYNNNNQVAAQILTDGSDTQKKFNLWLDRLVAMAKELKGSDGKNIPLILRPFHEHTQSWSWWGTSCTTEAQFKALWQYFVNYMKKSGAHSFIYAISPQMDSKKTDDEFFFRWPGDDYVDFIGMDCYQGINNNVFVSNLKALSRISSKKKKPAGVTETGVEGFKNENYWIDNIAAPMAGRKMSLLVTWRNKYDEMEQGSHYFSVFPGHPSEESFRTMYARPDTYFCNDLPNMYVPAENVTVQ